MEAQESLAIIEQMIAHSKKNIQRSAKYFLLWGWGIFIAMAAQYIMLKLLMPHTYYVWVVMPLCVVITIILSIRDRKNERVKTYTGSAMSALWTAMMISFILLTFIGTKLEMQFGIFPLVLLLYGIGTFTSGRLLDFKPLVLGGLFSFAMSVVCTYVDDTTKFLIVAIALLVSYIIPGHLLLKADNHE